MGRPPGRIQDRPFQMRLSGEFLERLDGWRRKQPHVLPRAEAIRSLTTAMLEILEKAPGERERSKRIALTNRICWYTGAQSVSTANVDLMTPSQCRSARALLDMTQPELARAAHLGLSTVVDFERMRREVSGEAIAALRRALERKGIIFIDENDAGPGLRLRSRDSSKTSRSKKE
jgi:DNA-binding transcriptional regulator YiaG